MNRRKVLMVLGAALGMAFVFASISPNLPLHWVFGLAIGWILQRSAFCFVSAVRDPLLGGTTVLARALIVAIGLATVGFTLVTLLTGRTGAVAAAGINTLAGGALFGVGMVIAGGCALGTLMRMGDGFVMQWLVFVSLLAGSLLGAKFCCGSGSPLLAGARAVFLPEHIGWLPSLVLQTAGLCVLWWLAVRHEKATWGSLASMREADSEESTSGAGFLTGSLSPLAGGAALAVLSVAYFALAGRPWGIVTELTYWAAGISRLLGLDPGAWNWFALRGRDVPAGLEVLGSPGTALNLGLVLGSFLASSVAGRWRLRRLKNTRLAVAAILGGLLMGVGSNLSMGCNIGGLFNGMASLSLHGWIYLFSLYGGAVVGTRLAQVFLLRPALLEASTAQTRQHPGISRAT
jgi:hypothetical protein